MEQHPFTCPYLPDRPEGGLDRPSPRSRVSPLAGLPVLVVVDEERDPADVLDRVVVVVDLGREVVVADFEVDVVVDLDLDRVVVVVADPRPDAPADRVVVVVTFLAVDGVVAGLLSEDFGLTVVVVAFGTLASSLAPLSSRAGPGVPEAGAGGDPGGGGIRSSRRAYCMIRANTGADTWPP